MDINANALTSHTARTLNEAHKPDRMQEAMHRRHAAAKLSQSTAETNQTSNAATNLLASSLKDLSPRMLRSIANDLQQIPNPTGGFEKTDKAISAPATTDPIQNLLDAWGTSDAAFDLNDDGTVNLSDLMLLLNRMNEGSQPDAAQPSIDSALPADEAAGDPVQQLFDAWGTDNPSQDFNNDGTVNIDDLMMLLQRLNSTSEPGIPQTDTALPATEAPGTDHVQELIDNWGAEGSQYDVNGDGTINTADLLELLSRLSQSANAPENEQQVTAADQASASITAAGAEDAETVTAATQPDQNEAAANDPVEALMNAWGTKDAEFDYNNDGVVNIGDLMQLLARINGGTADTPQPVAASAAPAAGGSIDQLVNTLYDRLSRAGFSSQPPTNVQDLLEQLNLTEQDSRSAMKKLASKYPAGLGVNMVG